MAGSKTLLQALNKLVHKLKDGASTLAFCYEAGPCGYGIHRQLTQADRCQCVVVAPSLIPKKPGDRVKTDRRDSESLEPVHDRRERSSSKAKIGEKSGIYWSK